MSSLLLQLLKSKPGFLPQWLFVLLLALCLLLGLGVVAVGLWVVFTQIDFM